MGTPIDAASLVPTPIVASRRGMHLGTATGFFMRRSTQTYLVTNWHVVTGRSFQTSAALRDDGLLPDRLEFLVPIKGQIGEWIDWGSDLYADSASDLPETPLWLEHPAYGHRVDVIALPVALPADEGVKTVETVNSVPLRLTISREVFVLGYPRAISSKRDFPIWKRASIATEPAVPRDGLPQLLIDTATREGMSGAPVIAVADSEFEVDGPQPPYRVPGRVYRFVGVYSGRLGPDEMQAQLGIVWTADAVGHIVDVGAPGKSSFMLPVPPRPSSMS